MKYKGEDCLFGCHALCSVFFVPILLLFLVAFLLLVSSSSLGRFLPASIVLLPRLRFLFYGQTLYLGCGNNDGDCHSQHLRICSHCDLHVQLVFQFTDK